METVERAPQPSPQSSPSPTEEGNPLRIDPDLDFIRALAAHGGDAFMKCFQCGTCSGTCEISPDLDAFPCKEMAWAAWGMRDRLLKDPDVWLCYQCNDCSTSCPRGARPGDVLAAVRQECVAHYAFPRFLGRWANQPQCIPLLLGIPAGLLALALLLKAPIENSLGISSQLGERIVYSYSHAFPHWLLNSFFVSFGLLVFLAVAVGVARFWEAMKSTAAGNSPPVPAKGMAASIGAALKSIVTHDQFAACEKARVRYWSHTCVFFGFFALCAVTLWVITAPINPLVQDDFIYPFGFWNPWKMLANLGGAALVAGCLVMTFDRMRDREGAGSGAYSDWALIATLLLVAITGFVTEILHYVRLEPHRHLAYFIHLVFVLALLLYLPYSKFAHIVYRTTAIVFAEHFGRSGGTTPTLAVEGNDLEKEEEDHVGNGSE